MIQAGADVNAVDNLSRSAFMFAMTSQTPMSTSDRLKCVKLLLKAGAHVNTLDNRGQSSLQLCCCLEAPQELSMILRAAGEILHSSIVIKNKLNIFEWSEKPEIEGVELCLKHMCREVIRNYLLDVNPCLNLFARILQLGLPSSLSSYLLYCVSLETGR